MASIMFIKDKNRWRVRKHVTDKLTGRVQKLGGLFKSEVLAIQAAEEFDRIANAIKSTRDTPDMIHHAVSHWLEFMKTRTQRTHDLYNYNIQKFTASLPSHLCYINQIQSLHIHAFIESLLITKTPATSNRYLTAIKSFCRWYSRKYNIPNPALAIPMQKESDPQARFLSTLEFTAIMNAANDYHKSIFQFIANTGLRASEFCSLTWSCLSDSHDSLTILGKGRKKRTIPLNQTCRNILNNIPTPQTPQTSAPIFMSKSNKKIYRNHSISRRHLHKLCADYARRLHIPLFGPHAFRHWFATRLLLSGIPIAHVSILLGHSSIATTQRHYIHILPSHLRGLTDCLDAANR